MKEDLENMITHADEPRYLLSGTDRPICNVASCLKFVDQLELLEDTEEAIPLETRRSCSRSTYCRTDQFPTEVQAVQSVPASWSNTK